VQRFNETEESLHAHLAKIEKTVESGSKRLNSMLDKLRVRTTNMSEKTSKEIAEDARMKERSRMQVQSNGVPMPKQQNAKKKPPAKGLFGINKIQAKGSSIGV